MTVEIVILGGGGAALLEEWADEEGGGGRDAGVADRDGLLDALVVARLVAYVVGGVVAQ